MEAEGLDAARLLNEKYGEFFNGNRFRGGYRYRAGNVVEFGIYMEGHDDPICVRTIEPKSLWTAISMVTGRYVITQRWTRNSEDGQKQWQNIADLIYLMCPLTTLKRPYEDVREALCQWVAQVGVKKIDIGDETSRAEAILNIRYSPVLDSADGNYLIYAPAFREFVRASRLPLRPEDLDLGLKNLGFVTSEGTRLQQREPATGRILKVRLWKGPRLDD